MTPQWGVSELIILRAAGWEVFHDSDEYWVAIHATTGRIARTSIDYEKTIKWRNLPVDSIEEFEACQQMAAYYFSCCLSERHDQDNWLARMDQEDES